MPHALRAAARLVATLAWVGSFGLPAQAQAAFAPPPLTHLVTDTSGRLSSDDLSFLNDRLGEFRAATGRAIVVLVAGSLEGDNVDDAAYTTFNTWKVGEKGQDDGVLLLIAPTERKVRIETGKGVGGDLTDLQANDIIRRIIGPRLKANQFREAIQEGTDAIASALAPDFHKERQRPPPTAPPLRYGAPRFRFNFCLCPILLFFVLFRLIFFRRRRGGIFWGGGWGGGGFGGGDGGGWGGGGGDGGGYSGGGGESGGGGSSDSY